ncbi:MAG: DUF4430 domain-containing protein [Planctomycetales bacterium]|nr:DUF4430 domain-containing protein [Planctomycetales bacterium]
MLRVAGRLLSRCSWGGGMFAMLLLGSVGFAVSSSAADDGKPDADAKSVKLIVDFGDGFEKHFTALPWKAKMTVADAVELARQHPRGIKTQQRGSGATAFLESIDGLKNEGRGRNWIFRVDGQLGDRSFALFPVEAGDIILWKFEEYR